MTRKHYKLFSEAIRYAKHSANTADAQIAVRELVENLTTVLKLDNPKFDRDKFLSACGFK